jgi:thioredoxin reductase (NADPH)
MAAFAAAEYLLGEKPLLQYTTTSARLHAILGVAHPEA